MTHSLGGVACRKGCRSYLSSCARDCSHMWTATRTYSSSPCRRKLTSWQILTLASNFCAPLGEALTSTFTSAFRVPDWVFEIDSKPSTTTVTVTWIFAHGKICVFHITATCSSHLHSCCATTQLHSQYSCTLPGTHITGTYFGIAMSIHMLLKSYRTMTHTR